MGIALAAAGALIGMSMSAAVASDPSAEADASALTATGALVGDGGLDLNTGECKAEIPGGNPDGAANGGPCGEGLATKAKINAVSQEAKASGTNARCAAFAAGDNNDMYGTQNPEPQYVHPKAADQACATASVGPIDLTGLASISVTDILNNGLGNLNTGTIVNSIVDPVYKNLLKVLLVDSGLSGAVDTILHGVTAPVGAALPVSLNTGAVEAAAAAGPSSARGNSRVASVKLTVDLGPGGKVDVPFTGPNDLDTPPNTPLLAGSPNLLAQAIFGGVKAALTTSLNGALGATIPLVDQLAAFVDTVLVQLQASLLKALEDGLAPLVQGTVNKQVNARNSNTPVTYTAAIGTKQIEVTGLNLVLFQGAAALPPGIIPGGGATQTLKIARVHAGPAADGDDNTNNPGLQVLKTEKVNGDDEAEWTIRVHNPLGNAVDNVFVKDFYPKELDKKDVKVSSISKGSFDKNTGIWTVGTIAAGATETLRIRAELDEDDLADGVDNAICVNRTSRPNHIQKNDTFRDDTDGCDTANAKSDEDDDDDDSPKSINSGISGGDLSAAGLAGLLAMTAMGGSVARRRFNT